MSEQPQPSAERLYCSVCGEARGAEVYTCRKGGKSLPVVEMTDAIDGGRKCPETVHADQPDD